MKAIDNSALEYYVPNGSRSSGNIKLDVSAVDFFNNIDQHGRCAGINIINGFSIQNHRF